jgi:hypothetical protein
MKNNLIACVIAIAVITATTMIVLAIYFFPLIMLLLFLTVIGWMSFTTAKEML